MLTVDSMSGTVDKCLQYPGYRAAVIFRNCENRKMFADSWAVWASVRGEAAIEFDNGSVIMLYAANRYLPNQPVNEYIVDGDADVPEENLPTLIPYTGYFRNLHGDDSTESCINDEAISDTFNNALDDFLAEFRVLKANEKRPRVL